MYFHRTVRDCTGMVWRRCIALPLTLTVDVVGLTLKGVSAY